MKVILLVSNINMIGGIERVACKLANCFYKKLNYQVEIISMFSSSNLNFFEIDSNIKITHANLKYKCPKNHFRRIKNMDENICEVLKNKNADIILTFYSDVSMAVIRNRNCIGNSKVVVTEHIDYFQCSRKGRFIRNYMYKKADCLVVLHNEANKLYSKFLKNVVTIPNIISFETELKSNLKNKKMISVGRLDKDKGFDILIEIFNRVNKINNEWSLDIVGEGPEKNYLLNKIKDYQLDEKIKIKPFTKDIKSELLHSSIYTFTSKHEGFGLVLIEAQECGLPIISFDITSAKEIISNNESGIIVDFENLNKYSDKLLELMGNYEKRYYLGSNGKKSSKNYYEDNISLKWKELFEELVN